MFRQRLSRGVLISVAFLFLSPGLSHTRTPESNQRNSAPVPASSELLGTWVANGGSGSTGELFPHVAAIWIRYFDDFSHDGLFKDIFLDTTDIGITMTASDLLDPEYANVVDHLTNGIWEGICIGVTRYDGQGIGGCCLPEYDAFNLGVVDFYGATIDSVSLTLDDLWFEDTQGTVIYFFATMRVYGDWNVPVETTTWGRIKSLYR